MKLNKLFLAQLERDVPLSRRVLERVPEGRNDWRPHPKSMPLGYLAALVASMPSWIAMMLDHDEHDIYPAGSRSPYATLPRDSTVALLKLLEDSAAAARRALASATEERLMQPWRLLVGGKVVNEQIRHVALSDAVFSHLAHHRGQLTVYLRLNDAPVPAIYGPSADEHAAP